MTFDDYLDKYRIKWEAGDFPALIYATRFVAANKLPMPEWMHRPILDNLNYAYWSRPAEGKAKDSPKAVYQRKVRDRERWSAVEHELFLRKHKEKVSRDEALERAAVRASKELTAVGLSKYAHVTAKQIEKTYYKVKKAIEEGRGFEYLIGEPPAK